MQLLGICAKTLLNIGKLQEANFYGSKYVLSGSDCGLVAIVILCN